jgi:hypothetical protein
MTFPRRRLEPLTQRVRARIGATARIRRRRVLGGLIHEYERTAWRSPPNPENYSSEAMGAVLAPYRRKIAEDQREHLPGKDKADVVVMRDSEDMMQALSNW